DIQIGAEAKPTSPRLSLNFKAAKWTKFRSKLDQQLILWNNDLSLNSSLDIEDYSTFITNSIMLATQEAVPTSTPTSKSYTLSEACKSSITLKHQAYRRWKRTGDNIDKRQYYVTISDRRDACADGITLYLTLQIINRLDYI
ncbi:unnamed protein product, partial [Rotaria socialis]